MSLTILYNQRYTINVSATNCAGTGPPSLPVLVLIGRNPKCDVMVESLAKKNYKVASKAIIHPYLYRVGRLYGTDSMVFWLIYT